MEQSFIRGFKRILERDLLLHVIIVLMKTMDDKKGKDDIEDASNGLFNVDVLVVGAGHAGCEAAFASARMGCKTILITSEKDTLGLMPCNPAVGGLAKSHLVVELDALAGKWDSMRISRDFNIGR